MSSESVDDTMLSGDNIDLGNKNYKPGKENSQIIYKFVEYICKSKSDRCEYKINTRDEILLINAQD